MNKIKVFVVDDSPVARTMLTRILQSDPEIEVVGEAGSGQGSIIMLDEVHPDIVMLEATIGGRMGIDDVVKEIRNLNENIKIIICSAQDGFDQVITAAQTGPIEFVRKPYQKINILRVIHEMMEG